MSTEFGKLQKMYVHAMESPYSDFYRAFYGSGASSSISSIEEWHSLPFLTREDIEQVPLSDRIFTPLEEVSAFRATSGTSGRKPLITPRKGFTTFPKAAMNCSGLLLFYNSPHLIARGRDEMKKDFPIVVGSFNDTEQSVQLAAHIGVDALFCFPFQLQELIPLLQKYDVAHGMKSIELTGERVSEREYTMLRTVFPNAEIFPSYGATELQAIAAYGDEVPTPHQNILRPSPHFFWEIVDEYGAVVTHEGAEGSLVLTSLNIELSAFPLLRYAIGDYMQIVAIDKQENITYYKPIGRPHVDIAKIPGGVLYADNVSNALENVHPDITNIFEGHVFFKGKKAQLDLHVVAKTKKSFTEALRQELAEKISGRIFVGPNNTYQQGVEKGLYENLSLTITYDQPIQNAKRKPFTEHYE